MFLKQLLNTIFNKSYNEYDFAVVGDDDILQRQICILKNGLNSQYTCYSAFLYKDKIRELIHFYKFQKKIYLSKVVAKILYDLIIKKMPQISDSFDEFELVCVPCHYFRVFKRGFNHMSLVCKELEKLLKIKFNKKLIIRSKYTPSLYNKTKKEREKIINGCFKINNSKTKNRNKKIILIDDILTSGTTMKECIKTLNDDGFENIYPFTVAST